MDHKRHLYLLVICVAHVAHICVICQVISARFLTAHILPP
nr:MAG TPA_asm: hypothetical protein [Caudoviricetes sp.]